MISKQSTNELVSETNVNNMEEELENDIFSAVFSPRKQISNCDILTLCLYVTKISALLT
jgi:hypothetical protein